MSVMYCEVCDKQIDTDKDVEHFERHEQEEKDYQNYMTERREDYERSISGS